MAAPIKAHELKTDFPENAEMLSNQHIEDQPTIDLANGATTTRARQPANYDGTFVSDERKKATHIGERESVKWVLDPKTHNNMANPLDNWLWEPGRPGRRLVPNPYNKGELIHNMDCVLAAYPIEEDEERQREIEEGQKQFLEEVEDGDYAGIPRHRPEETLSEMAERGRYEAQIHAHLGLIGQFAGQPWQEVLRNKGPKWWMEEQARHRGGPAAQDLSAEEALQVDAQRGVRQRRADATRDGGGKFISIPKNIAVKNISKKER